MPIAENFPEGLKPTGRINHSDGENFHFMWGPGRSDAEAFSNDDCKAAFRPSGKFSAIGILDVNRHYYLNLDIIRRDL